MNNIDLHGFGGKRYTFGTYTFELKKNWNSVAGIYVITNQNSTGKHTIIYIGMTNDLQDRFQNHHKENCFSSKNANRLLFLNVSSENIREAIERDLIENYKPICNEI